MIPIFIFGLLTHCILLALAQENSTTSSHDVPHTSKPNNSSGLQDPQQLEQSANIMFDEYWQIVLRDSPETATTLGDHRYDDQLDSYSLKCYEKKKVMMNEFLERANQMLSLATEGSETHINLELFITNLQFKLDHLMSGSYLFPISKMHTPLMNLRYLMKYHKLNYASQYWNLIARYRAMPKQIEEQIELMQEGIRTNFTLSERSMFARSEWNQSIVDNPFYKPFLNISDLVPTEEIDALQENASEVISNHLIPAFKKLDDFMENEYRPHLRPGIGVSSLPNGREFYEHMLTYHLTDTSVTPEEIHQTGLREVDRISKEMDEVIQSIGLNMSHKEFSDKLRNDKSQFFNTEEEALETYRQVLEREITPKILQLFKFIPDKVLTVEKVPKEMATGPQAYYMRPSPDNKIPGTFFLDTQSLGNLPKYDVVTLAMHEGVPGHHFQHAYVMEQVELPEFRKYDMHSTAFIEGWALYAEYLGYELGLYEDPYMRYGHLSYEIFRACRMVVDTGMHVLGWSRQQAIDYMMENSASSLNNIEREIDRYISWPGQACGYKYGELKIKEMRNKAEETMGDTFDIKEFHDIILRTNGPMELVAQQIDRYIEKSRIELSQNSTQLY